MRLMTSTIGEGRDDAEGMLSTARSSASSATQTGEERCKPERISLLNREKTRSDFVNGSLLELVHSQGNEERTYSSFPSRFYVQGEYTRQES